MLLTKKPVQEDLCGSADHQIDSNSNAFIYPLGEKAQLDAGSLLHFK
jgi:hypothetical protein